MNRVRSIFKFLVFTITALVFFSCAGPVNDFNEDVTAGYPVHIYAGTQTDTRISVDGLSLTWEQNDTLALCAVASDGTYANSELSVYQIDPSDCSKASFSGFVSMLSQPEVCFFMYPNSAATSYNSTTRRVKFQYNSQTGRHEPMMYARTAYNEDGMEAELKHI